MHTSRGKSVQSQETTLTSRNPIVACRFRPGSALCQWLVPLCVPVPSSFSYESACSPPQSDSSLAFTAKSIPRDRVGHHRRIHWHPGSLTEDTNELIVGPGPCYLPWHPSLQVYLQVTSATIQAPASAPINMYVHNTSSSHKCYLSWLVAISPGSIS